jgi:hypothetical protein
LYFVNECRLADTIGVAVALDGAPLMRFVKRVQGIVTPEATAFGVRLNAIASRGKAEDASCSGDNAPLTETAIQRRFWTPDEVSSGAASE